MEAGQVPGAQGKEGAILSQGTLGASGSVLVL
jgi:hypothetical protein